MTQRLRSAYRIGTRGACALLSLSIAGCASVPSEQARGVARHRDAVTGEHRIGVALGRFVPPVAADAEVTGKGGGTLYGAGRGAVACLELERGSSGFGAGLVTLVCLPFGAAIGALAGAYGSASGDEISTGLGRLDHALATLDLQAALGRAIDHYADRTDIRAQFFPLSDGPAAVGDLPRYPPTTDYVFEAAVTEVRLVTTGAKELPYGFQFQVRARLIRSADGAVLDTLAFSVATPARTLDEWLADKVAALARAIDTALAEAAEAIVDEWSLIHRGDAAPAPPAPAGGEPPRVPEYALQPLAPPLRVERRFLKRPLLPGHLEPVAVSTRPRFAWEALPRDWPAPQPAGTAAPPVVVYDLRLYDGGPFPFEGVAATAIVQEHFGLSRPEFAVVRPLQPCAYHFWTVRARFLHEGRMRATEWTGAYRSIGGTVDPGWARRGEWPLMMAQWPNRWFYLPFLTGAADGRPCP